MGLWSTWKRRWRQLETTPSVLILKRRVRQLLGTELRHFVQVRRPVARYGEWTISTADLKPDGLAYCVGVGEDAVLDLALVERFGLEVHAFDPTPRAVEWVSQQRLPEKFHFHPVGVADYDGTAEFSPSSNPADPSYSLLGHSAPEPGRVSCEVRRLSTLRHTLGHGNIDFLKMDIEGAEYAVIDDLLSSGLQVNQILIEFHHRFRGVGRRRTQRAVQKLEEAGYRIFSISPNGREYSFILQPA